MIYFSTILFVNCLIYLESNLCRCGSLQVLENKMLCNLLISSQLYLGFHGLRVICEKMHLLLEICFFFFFSYLTFLNRLICYLLDSDNRNREYIANNHYTRLLTVASFRGGRVVR